jgi:hypothetical protein
MLLLHLVWAVAVCFATSQQKPFDYDHHWDDIAKQFDVNKDGVVHGHEIESSVRKMLGYEEKKGGGEMLIVFRHCS